MTTYTGPVTVTAVAQTRAAYYIAIGSTIPPEETGADTGYLVSLPTGGDVWMTTAKFAANFTLLGATPTEAAVTAEAAMAQDKLDRLDDYIASIDLNLLADADRVALRGQRRAMSDYVIRLGQRLASLS